MSERQWKTKREREAAKAENEQSAKEMVGDFDPMARIRDLEAEVERLLELNQLHFQAPTEIVEWAMREQKRAEAAEAKLAAIEGVPDLVPTNWLDPLLTGPAAVIRSGYANSTTDIEILLRAVKKRLRDKLDAILAPEAP